MRINVERKFKNVQHPPSGKVPPFALADPDPLSFKLSSVLWAILTLQQARCVKPWPRHANVAHTHTHTRTIHGIRYDTIRDAILTCARKLTYVSLIYTTRNQQLKSRKKTNQTVKTDMLRSIGNSPRNPWRRKEGYGGVDLQKRKVLSLEWNSEGGQAEELLWWSPTHRDAKLYNEK